MPTHAPNGQHCRLAAGSFIGSFRILSPVGIDADGEIYLAKSSQRLSTFLIRLFPATVSSDSQRLQALAEYCRLASAVHHPGVARCSELESERGLSYVAVELPDGPRGEPIHLGTALTESAGILPRERVVRLMEQVCEALEFCHQFRRQGLPHGQLTLTRIYLTAQRQPRLADFSLLHPGSPEDDLRALGRLTAKLITGKDIAEAASIAHGGLSPFWQQFVTRCLAAGGTEGFQNAGDIRQALRKHSDRRPRPYLWLAASAVLTAALIAGMAVIVHRRGSGNTGHASERTDITRKVSESVATDDLKHAETLRMAADQAFSEGRLDEAGRSYEALLALTPADSHAKSRLRTIHMKEGLANVNTVKQRAENLYEQARDVPRADGFGERVETMQAIRKEAANAMAGMDFTQAAAHYRRLETYASGILTLDQDRKAASKARQLAESALETARNAEAAHAAERSWKLGNTHLTRAVDLWETMHFGEAEREYQAANRVLMESAAEANGNREMTAARTAFNEEKRKTDPILMQRLQPKIRAQIDDLDAAAREALAAKNYTEAAATWRRAAQALARALDRAAAAAQEDIPDPLEQFPRPNSGNLVANGDFEEGANGQPLGWSRIDGLTSFWDEKGNPGFCIRFDTDVQQKDKQRHDDNPGAVVARTPGSRYGTVGAHEGVWAFSPPIPVKPSDKWFILEADCMGPAKSTILFYPQVLIRGYQRFDPDKDEGTFSWFQTPHDGGPAFSEQFGAAQRRARSGDYLMVWRHGMVCRNSAPDIWEHYQLAVELPDEPRFRPEVILLKAYAMWPLGTYRFDNIVLRETTRQEFERVKAKGHSIEGFMPTE